MLDPDKVYDVFARQPPAQKTPHTAAVGRAQSDGCSKRLGKKRPSFGSTGCAKASLSAPWWLPALWHQGHIFNFSTGSPSFLAVEMLVFLCPPSLVVWLGAVLDGRISRAGGRVARSARALRGKMPAPEERAPPASPPGATLRGSDSDSYFEARIGGGIVPLDPLFVICTAA